MAHGYLTPTPVSGRSPLEDLLAKKAKKEIKKRLEDTYSKLKDLLTGFKGTATAKSGAIVQYSADPQQVSVREVSSPEPVLKKMLSGSNSKALGAGTGAITQKEASAVPNGGIGGGIAKRSRSTFTEIPGISSGGGISADTLFKQATTGVGSSGEYLTNAQRRENFIKSRQEAVKTSSATPPISPDSGIEIVAAVNRNTQMIVSLVEAVKSQTANDSRIVSEQIQSQRQLMLKSAADKEESALEQGADYSGFMTPENFAKRKKNEKKKEDNDKGSKLKEFFKGPNPFQKPEGCGCSPFMPGPGGKGPIFGGPPGGGGLPIPDYVDQWRDMNRRPGSRLGGGGSVTRRAGGARRATRLATKIGGKGAGKAVAKGLGKFGAKRIPGLGLLAGIAFGAERAMKGDWLGAAGEVASGALGPAGFAIDAGLAARDAGLTPFADGGIVTQPVASLMGEGNKAEGVFPLEGTRGKKTFRMFGEGVLNAQMDNDTDFAKLQAKGFKQYFETEGGGKKLGESLKDFFGTLAGGIASLFGGAANAGTLDGAADYLNVGGGGTAEQNLAAFTATLEGGSGQNAADAFQVMLNRAANAQQGGSMKAYGTTLGDQVMGQAQFSPISAVLYDGSTGDPDADRVYGGLRAKLGKTTAERKKKLLEIAAQGPQALQQFFGKGSASAADQLLTDFRGGGQLSQSAASGVKGRLFFKGQSQLKNKGAGDFYRGTGGNFFHGSAGGTVGTLSSVSPGGGMEAPDPEAAAAGSGANVVSVSHPDTGSGYSVAGLKDAQGRPVVMSRGGAVAFARMMKDSKGQVKGSDVASSQRSAAKNKRVGGVPGSKHLKGNALDIHGTSQAWMRKHGAKYGWHINDYPGSHGGHFDFKGGGSAMRAPATTAGGGGGGTPAAATPRTSPRASTRSSPGSLQASSASADSGTSVMAASQQVAMANTGGASVAPTIINNYYGGSGAPSVQGGSSPGIGMEQTGTAIFQDLRIRALA